MTSIFRDEAARARMHTWFERFRARIPHALESRTIATAWGDTHALVGGPADGPAVVVLHGAMASSAHVLGELAPLLAEFRVYAIDVVGQSVMTPHRRPSVATDDYGRWLVEVLDGLGLERAAIVGVSWGGFVAIRLAVVAPTRITRLALLVPAGVVQGPLWEGLTRLAWPMMMWRMFPSERRFRRFAERLVTTTDDDWVPYLHDAFGAFRLDMQVPKRATPAELAGFHAPTFVIGADRDLSFPGEKLLARAAELFPNLVDTELLRDTHHSPPTNPTFRTWMARRLAGFLRPSPAA